MIKKLFIWIIVLSWYALGGLSYAATQTYYVTSTGNASDPDCSGGGAPTCAGAWDEADIESSGNWFATEDAEKIDPGDIVIFGTSMSFGGDALVIPTGYGGTLGNQVTFDGYAAGSCDPINDSCASGVNITGTFRLNASNYITFRDFDFQAGAWGGVATTANVLSTGIVIKYCNFRRYSLAGIYWPLMNDGLIYKNKFVSDITETVGQNIDIQGGKRNKVIGNHTYGGRVGILWKLERGSNGGDAAGFMEDSVVAGNFVDHYKEEGIAFDALGDSTKSGGMEWDTVEADDTNTVTLASSGWDGSIPDYTGFYMAFMNNDLMGEVYQITGHSADTFTFAETVSAAYNADPLTNAAILAPFIGNYIGYNRVNHKGEDPELADDIILFGASINALIEYNEGEDLTEGGHDGGQVNIVTIIDGKKQDINITDMCSQSPCFNNLARYNNSVGEDGGMNFYYHNADGVGTGCNQVSSPTLVMATGNTAYNNVLDGRLKVWYQNYYEAGNTIPDGINEGGPATKNIAYAYDLPYILTDPTIATNGHAVSITWNKTVDTTGYSSGDLFLTVGDDIETRIALESPSGSGDTRTFTAASNIAEEAVARIWFDGADDAIVDSAGNEMGVVGYKTVTNNSGGWFISAFLPADDSTGTAVSASLSWTNPTGTLETLVYFGTDSTPDAGELVSEDSIETSYNPPGDLPFLTEHWWRVDIRHAGGTETGTVYSFTTSQDAQEIPPAGPNDGFDYNPLGKSLRHKTTAEGGVRIVF